MTELRSGRGEFRATKPLVRRRRALVPGRLDGAIEHDFVDPVIVGQWFVERYSGAKRLHWFIAGVNKGGRWLEADSSSTIAEGQIGGMMELQGTRQVEACARSTTIHSPHAVCREPV